MLSAYYFLYASSIWRAFNFVVGNEVRKSLAIAFCSVPSADDLPGTQNK